VPSDSDTCWSVRAAVLASKRSWYSSKKRVSAAMTAEVQTPAAGFNFELAKRNSYLQARMGCGTNPCSIAAQTVWLTARPTHGTSHSMTQCCCLLQAKGVQAPGFTKTGTTIAGIIYKASSHGGSCCWRSCVTLLILSGCLKHCRNAILHCHTGWRCAGSGHAFNCRDDCRRQELREDSLHRAQRVLLRRRNRRRHRERHRC